MVSKAIRYIQFGCGCRIKDNFKNSKDRFVACCEEHLVKQRIYVSICLKCGAEIYEETAKIRRICDNCKFSYAKDYASDRYKKSKNEVFFYAVFECGCEIANIRFHNYQRLCPIHKKILMHYKKNCRDCGTEMILEPKKNQTVICGKCYYKKYRNSRSKMYNRAIEIATTEIELEPVEMIVESALDGYFEKNLEKVMKWRKNENNRSFA